MGVIGTPLTSKNLKPSWELQADEEIIRVGKYGKVFEDDALRSFETNEGWAPTSFKSQRSNRAEVVTKEAHSLMDSRDVAEANKASILSILPVYDQSLLEIGRKIVDKLMGTRERSKTDVSFASISPRSEIRSFPDTSLIRLADVFRSSGNIRSDDFVASLPHLPLNFTPTGISLPKTRPVDIRERAPATSRNLGLEIDTDTRLTSQQASQALSGYMPFKNIPVKHEAYLSYLNYYAGRNSERPDIDESWEEEFHKAASFFKPLPSELSARFTRPSEVRPDSAPVQSLPKAEQSHIISSAGRESYWRPAVLLCKRFAVDAPPVDVPAPKTTEADTVVAVSPTVDREKCKSVFSTAVEEKISDGATKSAPVLGSKRSIRPRASDFM